MKYNKIIFFILAVMFTAALNSKAFAGNIDLEKFCKSVYEIYASDEVAAKKEVLVYKKLNEMIGQTYSMKITATDSVGYDRKTDMSYLKSTEVYWSDSKTGYFGVFVRATQKGDNLLMTSTPGKEMSITGKVADLLVTQFMKNNTNQNAYTSLKDFDDKGTVITQILLVIEI